MPNQKTRTELKMCPISPLYSIQKSVAVLHSKKIVLFTLSFSRHEHFSPDSTGIRTLNYLSCCTDWVSRYQPGSERNYRRSGSPNQPTAPLGQRSRFTPEWKLDTWTVLNATYLQACRAKVRNSTHQSLVPLEIQIKQCCVSMETWHFCCKRSGFLFFSEVRWCNCDP